MEMTAEIGGRKSGRGRSAAAVAVGAAVALLSAGLARAADENVFKIWWYETPNSSMGVAWNKAIEVWKGSGGEVKAGFLADVIVTVPKGEADKLKAELLTQQPLLAPVAQGQPVGTLRVTLDGKPLGEYPVVALEAVGVAGIFGRAWDTLRLWVK